MKEEGGRMGEGQTGTDSTCLLLTAPGEGGRKNSPELSPTYESPLPITIPLSHLISVLGERKERGERKMPAGDMWP